MRKGFQRADRVASLLREEVISIVSRDLKDPRVGFVTITTVDVSPDLAHAKVLVSILGDNDDGGETLGALQRAAGFIRRELGSRLRLRHTPELRFVLDDSARTADRIERLIEDWKSEKGPEEEVAPSSFGGGRGHNLEGSAAMKAIAQVIERGSRFLLTPHLSPDGDSLGSALAMAHSLRQLGKSAHIVGRDAVPERYRFLPGSEDARSSVELPTHNGGGEPYDAAFAFECPDVGRTGWPDLCERHFVVNLDHHEDNSLFGDINWVDGKAAAVGEMVYRLFRFMELEVVPDVATCIYTSVMTDTGSFTYSNTTAESLRLAATMVELGADPYRIALNVYDSNRFEKVQLLGLALSRLRRDDSGRMAWLWVGQDDLVQSQALPEEMDDLINYPRSIRGVEAAVIFKEMAAGRFRVSLRSKGDVDVFKVAKSFQGGGHRNASGFTIEGSYEEVRDRVLARVREALAESDRGGGSGS